ncbi:hypothetical protein ACWCXX_03800 [Streptomyces sp. NPDC001732]
MTLRTALRLAPGERSAWLLDQAVSLDGTEVPGPNAVRVPLRRK